MNTNANIHAVFVIKKFHHLLFFSFPQINKAIELILKETIASLKYLCMKLLYSEHGVCVVVQVQCNENVISRKKF